MIPGSAYLDVIDGQGEGGHPVEVATEVRVIVPPGTILLHHYEISHRATGRKNADAPWRCMFKLQFARCSEPTEPSWRSTAAPNPFLMHPNPGLADCWSWLSGEKQVVTSKNAAGIKPVRELLHEMDAETEEARIVAAYSLAELVRSGSLEALDGLVHALQASTAGSGRDAKAPYQAGSTKVLPRVAMRGLAAAGPATVSPLLSMLSHGDATVVAAAAFALGEAAVPSLAVVNALCSTFAAFSATLEALSKKLDGSDMSDDSLPYGGKESIQQSAGEQHDHAAAVEQIRAVLWERMDPATTTVRRVCAVCAQALGLLAGRATATAAKAAAAGAPTQEFNHVRMILGQFFADRLAEPEPGFALVAAGVIGDGLGGSTDKNTEVRQQLALGALRLASTGECGCLVGRYLNQIAAPALYDAGESTVQAFAAVAVDRLRFHLAQPHEVVQHDATVLEWLLRTLEPGSFVTDYYLPMRQVK